MGETTGDSWSSQVQDPYCELSTQQTADFLANLMLMVIVMIFLAWTPILNNSVCQPNSVSNLPTAYGNSDFPTTSQASNISTSTQKYASPNGNQAVKAAREI